ncbi:MAG: hypothetical protein ACK559_38175, partial [bacterium]
HFKLTYNSQIKLYKVTHKNSISSQTRVLFSKFVSVRSVENSDRIISNCGKSLKDLAEFQWKRSKKLAGSRQTLGMENIYKEQL